MGDEIRRWSEELAADASSLAFLPLGESLRRTGQLAVARRVALRGLTRHPHVADAHDLLARIAVDEGAFEEALDEWSAVIRLSTEHAGARKGLGYVLYKLGRTTEAEEHLSAAARLAPADEAIATALRMVRQSLVVQDPAPNAAPGAEIGGASGDGVDRSASGAPERTAADARALFDDLLEGANAAALLVDHAGLVMAGRYVISDGSDLAQEIGAALSGLREEAQRTASILGLGAWQAIAYETDAATIALAPAADDALLLVAAERTFPLGYVRRLLGRCASRAGAWLNAS